jgi:hypothetical protein
MMKMYLVGSRRTNKRVQYVHCNPCGSFGKWELGSLGT